MARWLRHASAVATCATAVFATALLPDAAGAQSLDAPKVKELYATAKREGQVIIWGTQRREVEWIPAAFAKMFPGIDVQFLGDNDIAVKAIAEARAHGDLSENAEYHAAKEQQSFAEGRINDIEGKLANAQIIEPRTLHANGRVVFSATVDLLDEDSQQEVTYQIVGDDEADIAEGKIYIGSPIARALIGKEEGDSVEVNVPDGIRHYEILNVRYV